MTDEQIDDWMFKNAEWTEQLGSAVPADKVRALLAAPLANPSDKQVTKITNAMLDAAVAAFKDRPEYSVRESMRAAIAASLPQSAEQERIDAEHSDDQAVDRFASAMKDKMAAARAKGRGGWEQCPPEVLSRMLREHIEKGDPRDVANFCMMLWHHQSPISAPIAQSAEQDRIDAERYRHLCETGFIPRDFEKQIDAEIAKGASK